MSYLPPADAAAFDETRRLAALHALALLEAGPEHEFDALVALAAKALDCPTAMLTLVDRDDLVVKARSDGPPFRARREHSICDHTIRQHAVMVVEDTRMDARFRDLPLVVSDEVRFYAAVPIRVTDMEGRLQPIGALCVMDAEPRTMGPVMRAMLGRLKTLAEALIAGRARTLEAIDIATASHELNRRLVRHDRIFRHAEQLARIGSWRMTLDDQVLEWSDNVYRIHGLPVGEIPPLSSALDFYPPGARERVAAALVRTLDHGDGFEIEEDFIDAEGTLRRVCAYGEREVDGNGVPVAIYGVFQDITDRHQTMTELRRSAETDMLTGIANRASFDRELDAAWHRACEQRTPLLLVLIDLDGFKAINDTLGHPAGDEVLRGVGETLRAPWLGGCFPARIGGDEFAVIVEDPKFVAAPQALADRIEGVLRVPVAAGGVSLMSAGTVGLAQFDPGMATTRDLIHQADAALYAAKRERIGERRTGRDRRGR